MQYKWKTGNRQPVLKEN